VIVALLVLSAGVAAVAIEVIRRRAQVLHRSDTTATVRRHRDFLDVLGAATSTTGGASSRP
jgi:hypothetical protein